MPINPSVRHRRNARLAVTLALLGQLSPAFAVPVPPTGTSPGLAAKIPADAVVFVEWNGADPAYATSKLAALMKAIDVNKLLDTTVPAYLQANDANANLGDYREAVGVVREVVSRNAAAYFRLPSDEPNAQPLGAVLVDGGADAATLETKLLSKLDKTEKHGRLGSVIWIGDDTLTSTAPSLADAAKFKAAADASAPGAASHAPFTLYIDLGKLFAIAAKNEPQAGPVLDALGISGIKSLHITGRFDKGDWLTNLQLAIPDERKGLVKKLLEPVSAADQVSLLAMVPGDALSVSTYRFDLTELADVAAESLATVIPDVQKMKTQGLSAISLMTGVRLKEDLFAALAPAWVAYEPADRSTPMVLLNKPRNPDLAAKSVDKFIRALARISTSQQARGMPAATVTSAPVDGLNVSTISVGPVALSWASKDGKIAFASSAESLSKALSAPTGGGIGASPKFKALESRLAGPAGSVDSYANLGASFTDKYNAAKTALPGVQKMLKGPPLADVLPPADKLQPLMTESASASWSDAAGWHYRSVAPFPGAGVSAYGAAGAGVTAGILIPSLTRAREAANRVACASNLRQIGLALQMEANEHEGKFPAKLGDVIKSQSIAVPLFVCPGGDHSFPRDLDNEGVKAAAWVNEQVDFVYAGAGLSSSSPADLVLIYERASNHGGAGRNVGFVDGHVELVKEDAFAALLATKGPDSPAAKAAREAAAK